MNKAVQTELSAELEVRGISIDLQNSKYMNWKLMVLTADVDLYNCTFVNCHGVEAESSANYPIPPHRPAAANHENKVYIFIYASNLSLTHIQTPWRWSRVPQTENVKNAIGMWALPQRLSLTHT